MRASTERGSVVGFVLVAVALVLVASGVIYLAKQQPDADSGDVAITAPEAEQKTDDTKNDTASGTSKDEAKDNAGSDTSGNASSENSTDTTSGSDTSDANSSHNSSVSEYSQTGPADTLMQLVAVGALGGSSVAYVSSRRRA